MTKIEHNGRTYTIRTRTAGQSFGTFARVRIGGRSFESAVRPLGFADAAIADVIEQVHRWQAR
jgi:hypothetical protein